MKITPSPPARVAWIETKWQCLYGGLLRVATREGGVDRNTLRVILSCLAFVATREGGVDRNTKMMCFRAALTCRHPRGWRG